eukprot:TCONS_00069299-protein
MLDVLIKKTCSLNQNMIYIPNEIKEIVLYLSCYKSARKFIFYSNFIPDQIHAIYCHNSLVKTKPPYLTYQSTPFNCHKLIGKVNFCCTEKVYVYRGKTFHV